MINYINMKITNKNVGFTIVELLVVIVVIGVLASITVVSYTGVTQKAVGASLKSDLMTAAKQLKMFISTSSDGRYPTALNCSAPGATEICLTASGTNYFTYASGGTSFVLDATNGTTNYRISDNTLPTLYPLWMTIGTQTWAVANVNVGTRIVDTASQTNNGIIEKYCYANDDANCLLYGGIYQWDELMQYVSTDGAQGICPAGSHVASDSDWKTLETYLGMPAGELDAIASWRGSVQNVGTQMFSGGASGLNLTVTSYRWTSGGFYDSNYGSYWTSTASGTDPWMRKVQQYLTGILRINYGMGGKNVGFGARCMKN